MTVLSLINFISYVQCVPIYFMLRLLYLKTKKNFLIA